MIDDDDKGSAAMRCSVADQSDILTDARTWLATFEDARDERRTHYDGCHRSWTHSSCLIRKMADEIERLRDLAPRWIPISERLPEPGVDVLLKMRNGYATGFVSPEDDMGLAWNWEGPSMFPPTHWMPMPGTRK